MSAKLPPQSVQIKALISAKPFDPLTVAQLESYASQQATTGTYDFDANKALLKFYQCYPDQLKVDVVASVLVLSLTKLPKNDFLMLSYLIPGRIISGNPKIKTTQKCAELLEGGKFQEFWAEYATNASELFTAAGFTDSIRNLIAENIKFTFKTINSDKFSSMIGLSSSDVGAFCTSSEHVQELKGSTVVMTSCAENQPRLQHFEESLRFDEALRLVDSLRRTEGISRGTV